MKAVVTGVAGFIGSNIARQLLSNGFDVVGVDAITDYYDPAIKMQNVEKLRGDNFEFIQGDLNTLTLDPILDNATYVFHQAGQPGVRKSWGGDFQTYLDCNVLATQRLLEHSTNRPSLKKLVYASSSSLYGNAPVFPTDETTLPNPLSPYGVSKLAAEHLCGLYAANYNVPTVSLRYFTVYGPGQRPDMAFTRFVNAVLTGGTIEIFGTGEQIRDFTYVDDVVWANLTAAEADTRPGAVFNVAGGTNVSVNTVMETLERIAGQPLNRKYVGSVPGDVIRTGGDTTLIQRELGWSPKVDLEEGLRQHLQWGRNIWGV